MDTPERILLCNDDGFDAPGIRALEEVLADLGEVWKIAPNQQRSGSSHALNFHGSVRLTQVSERCFKIENGYPADCANIGFYADGFPAFNLVISGINHGPNLGDDVHYSGTVAIARQGAIHHVRAVAVSAVDSEASPAQMLRIARWLKGWLIENFSFLRTRIAYSVNYPKEEMSGGETSSVYPLVRLTYQGRRSYKDRYEELECEGPDRLLRLMPTELGHVREDHSDFEAVLNGHISITPLSTYTTDIQELRRWIEHREAVQLN